MISRDELCDCFKVLPKEHEHLHQTLTKPLEMMVLEGSDRVGS